MGTCFSAGLAKRSTGVGGAAAGTLTFMVGGPEASFQRASDALDAMGSNVVHCGAVGTGQAAKICNNMMLGISMIGRYHAPTRNPPLALRVTAPRRISHHKNSARVLRFAG